MRRCVDALLPQLGPDGRLVLVNDGGDAATVERELGELLSEERLILEHHTSNRGVSAARNTGIAAARSLRSRLILMIDSDCVPGNDFVSTHLRLHREHEDVACFGGAVIGSGEGLWARLDGVMSWVHSVPGREMHEVVHPYHLPTTNFSVKTNMLPEGHEVFDERLNTGEDALLIRWFRQRNRVVMFSPQPAILHRDRESLGKVIRHHYAWGHHQYFIQLNRDLAPRCFNPLFRTLFLVLFVPLMPLYALAGSVLNIKPWLTLKPVYALFLPFAYLLWFAKGVAVVEAAIRPRHCLRWTVD